MKNVVVFCASMLLVSAFLGCIEFGTTENLTIKDFHFCSEINDQDDYVAHSREYTVGEQVFMYFELEGFKKRDDATKERQKELVKEAKRKLEAGEKLSLEELKLVYDE